MSIIAFKKASDPFGDNPGFDIVNGIKSAPLGVRSYCTLIKNLEGYGNVLCEEHELALRQILETYTLMAQGRKEGRIAFPLNTGLGKTQSIVAWISALYVLGHTHISIAVCASKVEALCDLKRDLVKNGVPEEVIGLLHSYRFDQDKANKYAETGQLPEGYASLPCTDNNAEKQILLVTHNRVRGKGGLDRYNLFKGQPRDLLIWDESLIISKSNGILLRELRKSLGWLLPDAEVKKQLAGPFNYLQKCVDIFKAELEAQKERDPVVLKLPELTAEKVMEYKRALGEKFVYDSLKHLLDISQNELRIVAAGSNDGLINYEIVVPPELKNVVVLDASHTIRKLVHLDSTVRCEVKFSEPIVSYENVTINQLSFPSGRNTMDKMFSKKKGDRLISREVAEVIKTIPKDEAVLIFTFKTRNPKMDFIEILKDDLESEGIDVNAKVIGEGHERDRINFLSWGNETSLSKLSFCSNVIFAGVLHRNPAELASCIAGQVDDLLTQIDSKMIDEISRSEIVHCLYQAMSRGASRVITGKTTMPMNVWLIHKHNVIEDLRMVMPGLKWRRWYPKHLGESGKIIQLAEKIGSFLSQLPDTVAKISSTKIKRELELDDVVQQTFTAAIGELCLGSEEWHLDKKSLVRTASLFNGL